MSTVLLLLAKSTNFLRCSQKEVSLFRLPKERTELRSQELTFGFLKTTKRLPKDATCFSHKEKELLLVSFSVWVKNASLVSRNVIKPSSQHLDKLKYGLDFSFWSGEEEET
jgi:hypothetical protein